MIGLGIGIPFGRRGGIDSQALVAYNSLIAAGFTCPQGLVGINAAFKTIKTIYGTSDITTAVSFFGDPALSYQIGTGSGTTLGQAIRTLPNLVDSTRATDAVQTTAASQPLLLLHSGENYAWLPSVTSNFFSTPDAAPNRLLGDLDLRGLINLGAIPLADNGILAKSNGPASNAQFIFCTTTAANLRIYISQNGTTNSSFVSTAPIPINTDIWVRVTRVSTTGLITFFTSTDGTNWAQLGNTGTLFTGNLFNGNSVFEVGTYNAGISARNVSTIIKYASISGTIGGAPTQIFNPNQYNPATSQTQWTSSSGEVWTINKSTGNTFTGALVYQNIIQGNNTTTSLPATIDLTQPATEYLSATRNGSGNFIERATGNSRSHNGTNVTMNNGTALNAANANSTRQIFTFRSNGASSGISINNGTETTGNAGTNNGTTLVLAQGAHNIKTVIQSKQNDTAPQRTAIFDYLKLSSGI